MQLFTLQCLFFAWLSGACLMTGICNHALDDGSYIDSPKEKAKAFLAIFGSWVTILIAIIAIVLNLDEYGK